MARLTPPQTLKTSDMIILSTFGIALAATIAFVCSVSLCLAFGARPSSKNARLKRFSLRHGNPVYEGGDGHESLLLDEDEDYH